MLRSFSFTVNDYVLQTYNFISRDINMFVNAFTKM